MSTKSKEATTRRDGKMLARQLKSISEYAASTNQRQNGQKKKEVVQVSHTTREDVLFVRSWLK